VRRSLVSYSWLEHIEARGRAPKTLFENRRLAAVTSEALGTKELRRLRGRDIDAFYDVLRKRGLAESMYAPWQVGSAIRAPP
jgi:hypothetical protein